MIQPDQCVYRTVESEELQKRLRMVRNGPADILVCGDLSIDTIAQTARTLSFPMMKQVRQVFVVTRCGLRDSLTHETTDPTFVDWASRTRAVRGQSKDTDNVPTTPEAAAEETRQALADLEDRASTLQPQISVVTIAELHNRWGAEGVVEYIDRVADLLLERYGIAQYYLPTADDRHVSRLSSHVTARLEIRRRDTLECRWYFSDIDDSTPWFSLQEWLYR